MSWSYRRALGARRHRLLLTGLALLLVGAKPLVGAGDYPRRAVMAAVARRIGPESEVALAEWLFAQNPIVHFGYRGGPDQGGQALTWSGRCPPVMTAGGTCSWSTAAWIQGGARPRRSGASIGSGGSSHTGSLADRSEVALH